MKSERGGDLHVFEGKVDRGGAITLPPDLRRALAGKRVSVRLVPRRDAAELAARGVSEVEIDRIAGIQSEPRDQVIRFLLTEGVLAKRPRLRGRRA